MAVEDQMEMNFGTPNPIKGVDPVSGNEIPVGSTAKEVRDDIPANLSEGEMVMAADIVRYYGVQFFEDLRDNAKMAYAKMEAEGRMGGEPMIENMGDDDIGLTIEDLEVVESMDAGEPEDAFLGKFFAGIREANKKQQEYNNKKRDRSFSAIQARAKANKNKPRNRAEAILQAIRDRMDRDNDRDRKKKTSPKKKAKVDLGFGGNPMERAARKYGSEPEKTKNKSMRKKPAATKDAGKVRQAYTGDSDTENVRYSDKGFFERLTGNLGFDEGGFAADQSEPFYDQKGGFDMEDAMMTYGDGTAPLLEMREYMNDQGHRIFITFINGVPQMEIPAGYYPVGDSITMNTSVDSTNVSSSSSDDDDSPTNMPTPNPVDYESLTLEELTAMVESQGSLKENAIAAGLGVINPIMGLAAKFAMWDSTRRTQAEIERRILDPNVSEVDKMRYTNLLELAKREAPTLLDKIMGKDFEKRVSQIPKPAQPDFDVDDPTKAGTFAAPYTPEVQTASDKTTPGVDKTAAQIIQDEIDIKRIEDEMKAQPRPTPPNPFEGSTYDEEPQQVSKQSTAPKVREDTKKEKDAQRRRDRQERNKNLAGASTSRKTGVAKSATRGLSSKEKEGGAELDSRFGISGLKKGGLAQKKGTKKKSK